MIILCQKPWNAALERSILVTKQITKLQFLQVARIADSFAHTIYFSLLELGNFKLYPQSPPFPYVNENVILPKYLHKTVLPCAPHYHRTVIPCTRYSMLVAETVDSSATFQYLAPCTGSALAKYFMYHEQHTSIISLSDETLLLENKAHHLQIISKTLIPSSFYRPNYSNGYW